MNGHIQCQRYDFTSILMLKCIAVGHVFNGLVGNIISRQAGKQQKMETQRTTLFQQGILYLHLDLCLCIYVLLLSLRHWSYS